MRVRGVAATVAVLLVTAAPAAALPQPESALAAVEYAKDRVVVQYHGAAEAAVVTTPASRVGRTLRALQADPAVAYAERDVVVRATDVTPDDPLWGQQWAPRKVEAPRAWSTTTGDPRVVVAVLDSGVDDTHEDLAGATVAGWNTLTGTADTRDDNGHGTAAASIVGARTDNGRGVAGICWSCEIMPVKVLDAAGAGYMSDLAEGIRWAVDHGASVISMSLAGPASTRTLDAAVAYANDHGVILVASAGNQASTTPTYPAASDGVVGVAASTPSDQREGYSNHGRWVDVAAPGCNHVAAAAVEGGGYRSFCGTSSAAPVVSGALGLARAAADTDVAGLRSALTATAVPVGSWVRDGRVDAGALVEQVDDLPAPPPDPEPEPDPDPEPDPEPEPDAEPDPLPAPQPAPLPERLSGENRYATAAAISAASHEPGVARVYIGTGRQYPDALAAGPAAAAAGGPVLLTGPTALPEATAAELDRLQPREIVVVGGTASVSSEVEHALARYGPVRRVAGPDRYSTAAAVARDAFDGAVPVLYIASGRNFPDALAGGAAAAAQGAPLLLTEPGRVPAATEAALRVLRPDRIVVLGGAAAIADSALGLLGLLTGTVSRVSGANRFATAGAVSRWAFPSQAEVVYLATGMDFPDALAGGPAAAATKSPLLLVQRDTLPADAAAELARLRPRQIVALGGPAAVSSATLQAARSAAGQ